MAEEHGFQAPEGHILCANNCGFFGSSATLNLCSKCYRDFQMKEEQGALAKAAFDNTQPALPSGMGVIDHGPSNKATSSADIVRAVEPVETPTNQIVGVSTVAQPNRCLTCSKRVGLTGFKCRCGSMYCGSHRYPEQHGCSFDYKKVGKEAIAKANPLIKAEKLDKI